jgi:hypothetical protein
MLHSIVRLSERNHVSLSLLIEGDVMLGRLANEESKWPPYARLA